MKKFLIIALGFIGMVGFGQNSNIIRTTAPTITQTQVVVAPITTEPLDPNSVTFDYDDAGNQVVRKPIVLAARPGRTTTPTTEEPKAFVESDIYTDIKYYPNPTVEILYVQWKNGGDKFVSTIQVFNLSGQLMGTLAVDRNFEQIEVDFRAYPTGLYELVLGYNNGKQKTLKIIKQ